MECFLCAGLLSLPSLPADRCCPGLEHCCCCCSLLRRLSVGAALVSLLSGCGCLLMKPAAASAASVCSAAPLSTDVVQQCWH